MNKQQSKVFFDKVWKKIKGIGGYAISEFDDWFYNIDQNHSGAIEKHELAEVLGKVGLTETKGRCPISQYYYVNEGKKQIKKLVELQRLGKLNYLNVCEHGKKIFKSFDFDGNAILDGVEMKIFLDTVIHEMNYASGAMTKSQFKKLFEQFDKDGGGFITCKEFIPELSILFNVTVPEKYSHEHKLHVGKMIDEASIKN